MLDTNIVSALARDPHGIVARRIAEVGPATVCVSLIVSAELRYGCSKKGSPELFARIKAILASMDIIALDAPVDAEYGRIRAELETLGQLIGPNDLFIAAHARSLGAVLVTANVGEFERVKDLRVENWLA